MEDTLIKVPSGERAVYAAYAPGIKSGQSFKQEAAADFILHLMGKIAVIP